MKIRMKTLAVGPGFAFHPNKEYTVADAVGGPIVEGGYAVRLDAPVKVVADAGTAELPKARRDKPIDRGRHGKR